MALTVWLQISTTTSLVSPTPYSGIQWNTFSVRVWIACSGLLKHGGVHGRALEEDLVNISSCGTNTKEVEISYTSKYGLCADLVSEEKQKLNVNVKKYWVLSVNYTCADNNIITQGSQLQHTDRLYPYLYISQDNTGFILLICPLYLLKYTYLSR